MIQDAANKRIEELVNKRVEEELEKRKEEIEAEVARRIEEAKKVMEKEMMEELERRRQQLLEEEKKREVQIISIELFNIGGIAFKKTFVFVSFSSTSLKGLLIPTGISIFHIDQLLLVKCSLLYYHPEPNLSDCL